MGNSSEEKPLTIVLVGEAMREMVVALENVERDEDGRILFDMDDREFAGVAGDVVPNMATYIAYTLTQVAPEQPVELRIVTGDRQEGSLVHEYFDDFKETLEEYNPNITVNTDFIQNTGRLVSTYTILEKDGKQVDYVEPTNAEERPTRFLMSGRFDGAGSVMLNKLPVDDVLDGADLVVTSQILHAISQDREQFVDLQKEAGERGIPVMHSTNLRQNLWEEKDGKDQWKEVARERNELAIKNLPAGSMVAASFDDELKLYPDKAPDDTAERIAGLNANLAEIVVTNGTEKGVVFARNAAGEMGKVADVVPDLAPNPIDVTGAGDSTLAAYTAMRQAKPDLPIQAAANIAAKVSKEVVQQKGGNIPLEDLPDVDYPKREARGGDNDISRSF